MKIGLNGRAINTNTPAGPERFTINLYKTLAKIDKKNHYTIYFDSKIINEEVKTIFHGNPNFGYKILPKLFFWTHTDLLLELLEDPVDVFFTPVHTLPFVRPLKTKYVLMVHGLEYKTNNDMLNPLQRYIIHPLLLRYISFFANKIVVPSTATKNNVVADKLANPNKIEVINEGVTNLFKEYDASTTENIISKYDLTKKKYLLFVSTIQPRKNIILLIRGFAEALKNNRIPNDLKLVLVGKLGWQYDEILHAPEKYKVEENVRFLNWVPQEDLPFVFSGAAGYVNFSVDEGFGLTVLEAMASKIPVLVSNIDAHKELARDSVEYCNPSDVREVASDIEKLVLNYPTEKINQAHDISQNYTWEATAEKFIALFESLKNS